MTSSQCSILSKILEHFGSYYEVDKEYFVQGEGVTNAIITKYDIPEICLRAEEALEQETFRPFIREIISLINFLKHEVRKDHVDDNLIAIY